MSITTASLKALGAIFMLVTFCASAASPYESLAFALRQQTLINDLRTHCHIDKAVTDAQIKKAFLDSKENQTKVLEAANELKAGNKQRYSQSLAKVTCPVIK